MSTTQTPGRTDWVKFGKISQLDFIGKDTIAFGGSNYILFYDINSDVINIYEALDKGSGDGVKCMAGHRGTSIFAFAEKCFKPRILVYTYPEFSLISALEGGSNVGYLNLTFSEMEFLISLGALPDFKITFWSWRTGENLFSTKTEILKENQIFKCSLNSPPIISQMEHLSNKLLVWDFHVCYKKHMVTRTEVCLPEASEKICNCVWSPEDCLYLVDEKGDVYVVDGESKKIEKAISWAIQKKKKKKKEEEEEEKEKEKEEEQKGEEDEEQQQEGEQNEKEDKTEEDVEIHVDPVIAWFKGGIIESGPDKEVRYLKRSGSRWNKVWSLFPDNPVWVFSTFSVKDILLSYTEAGELLQLKLESASSASFITVRTFGSQIEDICVVNPTGDHVVSIDTHGKVVVWETATGTQKSTLLVGKRYSSFLSHTIHPYLLVGMEDGIINFINVFSCCNPYIFKKLNICDDEISSMRITHTGTYVVAATVKGGQFFVINLSGGKIKVQNQTSIDTDIADFTIFDEHTYLMVAVLEKTRCCCVSGDVVYMLTYSCKTTSFSKTATIILDGFYSEIRSNPFEEKGCFAVPHRSRHLRVLHATKSFGLLRVSDAVATGHKLRRFSIDVQNEHYLTCGMDGSVYVHAICSNDTLVSITPHHRTDYGVKKAIIDPKNEYIISLGHDGTVVCTETGITVLEDRRKHLDKLLLSSEEMFAHQDKTPSDDTKTWVQHQKELKEKQESVNFAAQREAILTDFKDLQEKVVALLQKNYTNPPEEQLPIRCFDLDLNLRKEKTEAAKVELIKTKQYLESLCVAQDNLCQLIIRETWDKLDIKRKHIKAFLGEFEVENYAFMPPNKKFEKELRLLLDYKTVVSQIAKAESLEPWIPQSDSKHKLEGKSATDQTASEKLREAMLEAEDEKEESDIVEEAHVFSGSSTHKYVELLPYIESQFETSSYFQLHVESVFLQKAKNDLRHFFNKKFDAMVSLKEKEMNIVLERNKRLRYILSELNNTEKIITDPEWTPKEKPETIITVEDSEVQAKPYISPSQQEILDKIAAEEEARRLAELADDFRERALVEMMDGVLELLWEHIIKRDIPKPACMLEKQPEDFNEDDLRAVKEYEEKVAFLMSERERYRQMLEAEFKTLSNTVREGMLKFDNQLSDLFLLKILVQSCIDQLMLKILRSRQRCHQRMLLDRQEKEILSNVEKALKRIEKLQGTIHNLQDITSECRSVYDSFVARDRNLDKNFKRDFPELSQFHCDQLYKTYKKRPKMHHKAQLSVVLLNELSQNSLTAEKPSFLPQEYLDFLKGLDNLDTYSHAPSNIDEDTWSTLCRVRRTKIECELKIKAMAMELAEAERTVAVFQKQLSVEKENHAKLLSNLKSLRDEKLYQSHNMQIQIVMKQGMVEIPTTGSLSDFDDAILINRIDVENINALILEAGKKKLDAMHEATNFRRGNICLEWEHKTMCMKIEDLQDELKTIESVKVTKEMQEYLKRSARGESDKALAVDKEIAIIKDQYEKKLKELDKTAKEIDTKIIAYRKENGNLDKKILEMNVIVNEQQLSRDLETETKEALDSKRLLETIMKRNRMVAKIQKQHNEILALQTELELLRLKTYPTLKYTTLT